MPKPSSNPIPPMKSLMLFLLPFLELARLDRPIGILAIVFPYLYGFFYAILTTGSIPSPQDVFSFRLPLILFSGFIARALGCAWNDIVDVELDRRVQRTRTRPLARGSISVLAACNFTVALLAAWIMTLVPLLPELHRLSLYAAPQICMTAAYPYTKRVTDYAQVFLGVTLGWGVLFGAAMGNFDVLGKLSTDFTHSITAPRSQGVLALYAAYIVWTVTYDTIYAFQDVLDDKKAGAKSMALRLRNNAKSFLVLLSVIQVGLLAYGGNKMGHTRKQPGSFLSNLLSSCPYAAFAVFATAVFLSAMIIRVDLASPRSCGFWFKCGSVMVGSSIGLGLMFQYFYSL